MKLADVGEVIAVREFKLVRNQLPPAQVKVLMGKPQHFPDHSDFYCPYQITGLGDKKVRAAGGVDAFQAIMLALSAIGVELETTSRDSGGELVWDAGERNDFGFPRADWIKD